MTLSLTALLVALVAVAGCGGSGGVSGGGGGGKAADFSGVTLDGRQVTLESFKGKPLALVFWASW